MEHKCVHCNEKNVPEEGILCFKCLEELMEKIKVVDPKRVLH
jgi:DNA-directed RNA polymerase subunit RPC12/RpoP